jgi:hypothetical protein
MAYWYKTCPRCRQGRLFIMRRDNEAGLHLHCEECEWVWDCPSQITQAGAGTLGIEYESEHASLDDIEASGWGEYALHEDE